MKRASNINEKIVAVVVTYNPDKGVIERVERIAKQVDRVIVVDNSANQETMGMLKTITGNVELVFNNANLGIAAALNIGMQRALQNGYEWVLTMDQDSEVESFLIQSLTEIIEEIGLGDRIAVIGSNYFNSNGEVVFRGGGSNDSSSWAETVTVITSGSLVSINAFNVIGEFREDFFIDCVDHEYCLRARSKGYRIVISKKPLMKHYIGNQTKHKFWLIVAETKNHSAIRRYYVMRNFVVLFRKYFLYDPINVFRLLLSSVKILVLMCLFEKNKTKKIKYSMLGILDGLFSNFDRKVSEAD